MRFRTCSKQKNAYKTDTSRTPNSMNANEPFFFVLRTIKLTNSILKNVLTTNGMLDCISVVQFQNEPGQTQNTL
jgi:hypothetical protein